jgi:hypothetical protein
MLEFRDYQKQIIRNAITIIRENGFVYLAMEVRTGKTLTALGTASYIDCKNLLFVTKKKAMSSIRDDYELLSPSYSITIINYESLHKVENIESFDVVVLDEAHSLGAFPKPSGRAKKVAEVIRKSRSRVILLSGTPTPESNSQMFHQVYGIPNNPFREYKNFYRFADDYVNKTQRKINGFNIIDYSEGRASIREKMNRYMISYTQKQAGFESEIEEEVLTVQMKNETYDRCSLLKKDLVVEMDDDKVILADTGAKLMSKLHQMYSGTVKFEDGSSMILDRSKADFIYWKFTGVKLGIFYKFKEELAVLKEVYGDNLTTDLDEFNSTDKSIALQIVSGREGISLRNAEYIVFYNIDFSATSYWQARDRMTTKDRKYNKIYWVFSKNGIERKVYRSVLQKKDYTLQHFRRDERSYGRI